MKAAKTGVLKDNKPIVLNIWRELESGLTSLQENAEAAA